MKISVVIIAKNEEKNLQKTLPSLSWADEIIVVDDHSIDRTKELAESFGCKVSNRKMEGFGPQKRAGVELAVNSWVLNMDADEVMPEALKEEILALDLSKEPYTYDIGFNMVFLGHVFKYGKERGYRRIRLFNKEKTNFDMAEVHEKVIPVGQIGHLKTRVLNHSYENLEQYYFKFNKYTTAGAEKLFSKGKNRSMIVSILLFPVYFLKHYILYGNIRNGRYGFLWSYLSASYHTVKYLKLNELNRKMRKNPN